jgi:hypothetical protein
MFVYDKISLFFHFYTNVTYSKFCKQTDRINVVFIVLTLDKYNFYFGCFVFSWELCRKKGLIQLVLQFIADFFCSLYSQNDLVTLVNYKFSHDKNGPLSFLNDEW